MQYNVYRVRLKAKITSDNTTAKIESPSHDSKTLSEDHATGDGACSKRRPPGKGCSRQWKSMSSG
jgi:hypothetical protein